MKSTCRTAVYVAAIRHPSRNPQQDKHFHDGPTTRSDRFSIQVMRRAHFPGFKRLHGVITRIESELARLEASASFVEMSPIDVKRVGMRGRSVVVQGKASMRSGIAMAFVVVLDVVRVPGTNLWLVEREEWHLKASVFQCGELLRYETGHRSHRQSPHLHGTWCQERGMEPPALPTVGAISISRFVEALEGWRVAHEALLPLDPPPLGPVRI